MGGATGRTPPIPRSALEKDPRPGSLFEGNPVGEGTKRRGTATPVHKGFGIVSKAEIDVFLELSCFFHDPANVGNLMLFAEFGEG